MNAYYTDPNVRSRILEYLGGDSPDAATALCLAHLDQCIYDPRELRPAGELDWFLERGLDIARSLADSESHLLHLDLEYVNFDDSAAAYRDPWRCFELQEPVVAVVESLLLEWGIRPLHLITGKGHHFIWRIRRSSPIAKRIHALVHTPELTESCMRRLPPILSGRISAYEQDFFSGLALVMEYVAQCIKTAAAPHCRLPVEVTAVEVGPGATGQREIVTVDISEYGDPLHTRMIRVPFTNYRKVEATDIVGPGRAKPRAAWVRCIPLYEMNVRQSLEVRQNDTKTLELARRASVRIPLEESGTRQLLDHYLASRLHRFHDYYYSVQHDPVERWPETYERICLDALPGCVQHLLKNPNDWLLKPAGIQMLTRCLLADGWHPRHIAGLIRSRFENPMYGWQTYWEDYEPGTRADFYTRLFAGLHLTGVDRLVDFNCTSTREKGLCQPPSQGSCELETARSKLLEKLHT